MAQSSTIAGPATRAVPWSVGRGSELWSCREGGSFPSFASEASRRRRTVGHVAAAVASGAAASTAAARRNAWSKRLQHWRKKHFTRRGDRRAFAPSSSGGSNGGSNGAKTAALVLQEQWRRVQPKAEPDEFRVTIRVFPLLLAQLLWSVLVVGVHLVTGWRWKNSSVVHPLLVGVLGLLLAFRTNQAYERHWSCGKALAELQKVLQSMLRYAAHLSRDDWDIYSCIVRHLIAFPIALKQHLKRCRDPEEYMKILEYPEIDDIVRTGRPHTLILSSLSMLIRPLRHRDDGEGKSLALWTQMDNCITQLQSISCNLDLVVQLPLPASYTIHTSRFIRLWIGTLPFVLLGFVTPVFVPVIVLCIAWALYSTEELAQIMEEPFGDELAGKPETIKLDVFCRRIIFALKQQVWVQETLDSRVNARNWVVTPEDLPKVRQVEKEEPFNLKTAWDVD